MKRLVANEFKEIGALGHEQGCAVYTGLKDCDCGFVKRMALAPHAGLTYTPPVEVPPEFVSAFKEASMEAAGAPGGPVVRERYGDAAMAVPVRQFKTGATRDSGVDPKTGLPKLAYNGFFSARVLKRRAEYMNKHRVQADGSLRAPDNWKKGIPQSVYLESLTRHVMDLLLLHEGVGGVDLQETLCAISFNSDGFLHEVLKEDEEVRKMRNCERGEAPPTIDTVKRDMNL